MENQHIEIQNENIEDTLVLATKWSRLGASLIDGVIVLVVTVPLIYFMGGFDGLVQETPVPTSLFIQIFFLVFSFIFYGVINWRLLEEKGQSIGKKALNIRVVYLDGSQASRQDILIKRYCPYVLFSYIPFVGGLISLANLLFIFGKQRRCLHDRIARTKVIKVLQIH